MSRQPWVNYLLIASNVLLFLVGFHGGTLRSIGRIDPWLLHPDEPQLPQFVTSVFLHGSFWHLLGNMVFLWVFGNAVNDRLGHAGYLAFYLAGGILAGIGYILLSGHAPVLGASGAISAVTGAYLVLFPRARVTLLVFLYFITYIEVSSLLFLLLQFIWNAVMSLQEGITHMPAGGVAYAAHSSGYLFGIVVAAVLLASRRHQFRRMVSRGYDSFGRVQPARPRQQEQKRWVQTKTVQSAASDTAAAKELELRRAIAEACQRHDLSDAAAKYLQLVAVAEDAVLPRQQQLDVANQLMAAENHPAAADAYERFLKHYDDYEHPGDIHLMLGLLYGRYLQQYDRAEHYLRLAVEHLRDPGKIEMARGDLQAVRSRRGHP
jgi:membrane associated rhomboid family serine protease